jgi:energy-coupling factor transporter ATP-binding protein EcfA2
MGLPEAWTSFYSLFRRYTRVVDACALQPDLEMLPQGDATEIGERGITVSGGQKQRLNIARAIYFDADLILMDDPLSAVDAHVGRHIFDNAIMSLMKDKARILATHQLWVLNRCDRIIWMEEGRIQAIDTFDNLMKNHPGFQLLMETTAVGEKHGKEDHVNDDEIESEKKTQKKKRKGAALMQAEERAVKSVPWSVYVDYLRASGSLLNGPIVLLLLIMSQGANIATSLWLSWWSSDRTYPLTFNLYSGKLTNTRLGIFAIYVYWSIRCFGCCSSIFNLRFFILTHRFRHHRQ